MSCSHFDTDLLELDREFERSLEGCGKFLIVIAVEGEVELRTCSDAASLKAGECALVASEEKQLSIIPKGNLARLLTTFVPEKQ